VAAVLAPEASRHPDRPDRAGFLVSRPGGRGAGIEAAGVRHRTVTYRPAAVLADTLYAG